MMSLKNILCEEDIEGLIKLGAPADEYNSEANEIEAAMSSLGDKRSEEQVVKLAGWPIFCMNLPQEWLPHPTRFSLGGEHAPVPKDTLTFSPNQENSWPPYAVFERWSMQFSNRSPASTRLEALWPATQPTPRPD